MPEGPDAIPGDPDRLHKRADRTLTQFNMGKWEAPHVGRDNPAMHQDMLGTDLLENSSTGQTLGVPLDTKVNPGQQRTQRWTVTSWAAFGEAVPGGGGGR